MHNLGYLMGGMTDPRIARVGAAVLTITLDHTNTFPQMMGLSETAYRYHECSPAKAYGTHNINDCYAKPSLCPQKCDFAGVLPAALS
jgi:hypothetical protein